MSFFLFTDTVNAARYELALRYAYRCDVERSRAGLGMAHYFEARSNQTLDRIAPRKVSL